MTKIICQACYWYGTEHDVLASKNPFKESEVIYGCPNCQSIERFASICDFDKCRKYAEHFVGGLCFCDEHFFKKEESE